MLVSPKTDAGTQDAKADSASTSDATGADSSASDGATTDVSTSDGDVADSSAADSEKPDSTTADSSTSDAPVADSSVSDTGSAADSSAADSSAADSSAADSSATDSSATDSSAADSSAADSSAADSSAADSSAADSSTADSSTADSSTADSSTADSSAADSNQTDAAQASWCDELKAFQAKCNGGTVECGAKFGEWCPLQDDTNSVIFSAADAVCLPKAACKDSSREDCRYRLYDPSKLTETQQKLLEDYCKTCSPTDVEKCKKDSIAYDPNKGPGSVNDIFVAVWELSDSITEAIRTQCTGAALATKPQKATCAATFANCAADPYLDALPDCP